MTSSFPISCTLSNKTILFCYCFDFIDKLFTVTLLHPISTSKKLRAIKAAVKMQTKISKSRTETSTRVFTLIPAHAAYNKLSLKSIVSHRIQVNCYKEAALKSQTRIPLEQRNEKPWMVLDLRDINRSIIQNQLQYKDLIIYSEMIIKNCFFTTFDFFL